MSGFPTAPGTGHGELVRALAHRNDELEALDAIGKLAARASDLGDFLDGASRIVEALTRCTGVGVYTHDPATHAIHLIHHRGLPAELAERVATAQVEPPAIFARPHGAADVVTPSVYPARFKPVFDELRIGALARVPLVVGARVIGVLAVGFTEQEPAEAEHHLRFLRPVGALIGAYIHSDRLLGSLRRRVSELTQANADARRLQVDLDHRNAELERAQALLIQRERLAALGALSAAVAHEVRNPLGVIFNAVGMLRRLRGLDDEGRGLVDMVGEEAERLNRIVADLLGFARPSPATLHPAPLAPIVEEAVRAALAGLRTPIDVAWELAPGLPAVAVDAGLVRQALINVVQNAAQAMARGGRLHVATAEADGWATVEITDSGHGIPSELRERIFEPFFTTRTSGTGLGLAIVKHVVDVHGGAIEVAPGPDGGTRFALRFPVAPDAATPSVGR